MFAYVRENDEIPRKLGMTLIVNGIVGFCSLEVHSASFYLSTTANLGGA